MKVYKALTLPMMIVAGCTSTPSVDIEADRAALWDAAAAYHEAASSKDAAAVGSFYDDEAMMIPPNADRVAGIEGVRNYRFGFIETPGVGLRFETARIEVSSSGDMGWTLAIGEVTIDRFDGPPGRDRVRDFHVWRKQEDGSWKVVVDIWNSEFPVGGSGN